MNLHGWSVDQNGNVQGLNSSLESINVELNIGNKNLLSKFSIVFEKMKQTVNNVQNEVLAKYNHDFFKTFSSNVIKSKQTCIKSYSKVS